MTTQLRTRNFRLLAASISAVAILTVADAAHAGGGSHVNVTRAGSGILTTNTGSNSGPAVRDHRGQVPQRAVVYCRHRCQPGQVPIGYGWNGVVRDHR
jgi:hypothetical protein